MAKNVNSFSHYVDFISNLPPTHHNVSHWHFLCLFMLQLVYPFNTSPISWCCILQFPSLSELSPVLSSFSPSLPHPTSVMYNLSLPYPSLFQHFPSLVSISWCLILSLPPHEAVFNSLLSLLLPHFCTLVFQSTMLLPCVYYLDWSAKISCVSMPHLPIPQLSPGYLWGFRSQDTELSLDGSCGLCLQSAALFGHQRPLLKISKKKKKKKSSL